MSDASSRRDPMASLAAPRAAVGDDDGRDAELAPEQAAAIDDRARDLFLAAGAGTGKTTVLVERFCEAVCATDGDDAEVGVERVLAFTFTERAAAELKRRIRAELGLRARAEEGDDPERARELRSLARDSESAWISTIHSFCRRVLASHPIAAGLDPGFRVLDEPAAARLADMAFEVAFRRFAAGGDPERFELAAAYRLHVLRTVVRAAHDELRSRGLERPSLPPLEAPDAHSASEELRVAASEALAATDGAKASGKFHDCRSMMEAALAATRAGVPHDEEEVASWWFDSKARALAVPEVERYHEARARLERRLVEARFAGHYEHLRELLDLFAEEYAGHKEERSALDFEDLQLRARRLLEEHPEIRARYARQFRHVMVDEFQDTNALQLALVTLLEDDEAGPANRRFTVGDELQSIYGFRHADVDVFRSERAAAEAKPDDRAGVRRLAGNFRSRPEVLALVNRVGRALFGEGYEPLALGASPAEAAPPEPAVEVLVTERKGWDDEEAPAIEISPDEQAQPWRVAEARFLAERLRTLHEGGVPRGEMVVLLRSYSYVEAYDEALEQVGLAPYVVGGRGYWSKQQVADVRSLLGCVANPLDDRALLGALASPACGVRPDTLWLLRRAAGSRAVWSALTWLYGERPGGDGGPAEGEVRGGTGDDQDTEGRERVDDERPEPRAEAQAAAGDRRERREDEGEDGQASIARERWRERAAEMARHVPADDADALRGFVAVLEAVRAEAPRLSLEALIDRVITATGYDLALLMRRPRGRRRMANVRKLMRLAREFEADEGRDLRGFLDFAESESESGAREAEAAVDAEGHDGVRLMTIHAAKGLEFPVVAVADLGRGLSAGAPPVLRLEPAEAAGTDPEGEPGAMRVGLRLARLGRKQVRIYDYVELEERAVEREREEERRILHVAMTRAESRLLLSGAYDLSKVDEDPRPTEPLIAAVLRSLAWGPAQASVEVDPPPLGPGVEATRDPVSIAVRVRTPEDGAYRSEGPGRGSIMRPVADGALQLVDRPLADPELAHPAGAVRAPVRAVSYSALSLYERCGYRFYAERVLGMRPRLPGGAVGDGAPEREDLDPERGNLGDVEELASRYTLGRVVHRLLEHSARHDWSPPDRDRVAELLRSEGADAGPGEIGRATRLVEAFLEAPIRREIAAADRIHAEAPFAFRAGGLLVRGEIDLLADLGSELLLVDYKSDALGDSEPGDHMERYVVQRGIYALAALRRYGKPVRVVYVFLERPDRPVEARFSFEDAPGIATELEATAAGITAGSFEVTPRPERSLCFDCPARERLCVHGPELTLRDSPD